MRLRFWAIWGMALPLAALAWRDGAIAYWLGAGRGPAPEYLADDPRIVAAKRDPMLLFGKARQADAIAVKANAQAILRSTPLEASAMSQLALASALLGGEGFKRKLQLAERLSRRDPVAQGALLNLAAAEGNYRATFDHLDKSLTTNPQAGPPMFASLVPLVAEPEVRRALARYARRPWFPGFLSVAAEKAADPADVAALMLGGRVVLPEPSRWIVPHMLGRLVDAGRYDLARRLAVAIGRATPTALDTFGFTAGSTNPSAAPLTWRLHSDDGVQTDPAAEGGLAVGVAAGRSAVIADRLTRLAPGDYLFEQEAGTAESGPPATLGWSVDCKSGAGLRNIWKQFVPLQQGLNGYRAVLSIPSDCPLQHWEVRVLADDRQISTEIEVRSVSLKSGKLN